jgi:hypothetical protein
VIDGRPAYGEQWIWGGELIQTAVGSTVRVDIDRVGLITLKNAAVARLATATRPHLVVASLIGGDMAVRLQQGAVAYIESCGSAFKSSSGASFDVRTRNGKASLDITTGTVDVEQRRRTTIRATTVRLDPNKRPVSIGTVPLDTKTGQSAQAISQWRKYYEGTGTSGQIMSFAPRIVLANYHPAQQPAQTDEPAVRRTVNFRLEPPTLGTIDPQGQTDGQGVVSVTFRAGRAQASGEIVADIVPDSSDPPGTFYEQYRRPVNVIRVFWTRTRILIAAGAVAAVSGCLAAGGCRPNPNKQLQQAPPPVIR